MNLTARFARQIENLLLRVVAILDFSMISSILNVIAVPLNVFLVKFHLRTVLSAEEIEKIRRAIVHQVRLMME